MRFFKLFFILLMALSIRCNAQFTISGIVKDSVSANKSTINLKSDVKEWGE